MPARRWIAALIASALVVSPIASAAPSSAASATCIAHGSLPAHVSLRAATVVRSVLRGSSGCYHQRTDNGATAKLHRPGEPHEPLRWRRFGATQKVKLYVNIDAPGRYRLTSGDVQVYRHDYRRVDSDWRDTSMIVKRDSRFVATRGGGGTVSGRAERYTKFGWRGYRDSTVALQRGGRQHWHTVATRRADAHGRVHFSAGRGARYRLSFSKSARVWGARSGTVRG
jgi:hypothetical protein